MHGWEAKKYGRMLTTSDYPYNLDFEFQRKICEALHLKVACPRIIELMKENRLPFKHYYVYNDKVIKPERGKWIVDFWTDYAKHELDR